MLIKEKLVKYIYNAFKAKGYDVDHVINLHNFSFNVKGKDINIKRIYVDGEKVLVVGTYFDGEVVYNVEINEKDLGVNDLKSLLDKIKTLSHKELFTNKEIKSLVAKLTAKEKDFLSNILFELYSYTDVIPEYKYDFKIEELFEYLNVENGLDNK